jgi:hypothetical protein
MNLACSPGGRSPWAALVALIYGTALFGSTYLLPVYMQMGLGLSASSVGTHPAALGPGAGVHHPAGGAPGPTAMPASWLVTMRAGAAGGCRSPAMVPTVGLASSLWTCWLLGHHRPHRPGLHPALAQPGRHARAGQGMLIPQGSSVINFVRTLGGAAGVSLCGIALEWRLSGARRLAHRPGAPSPARLAAFDEVFLMLAALCALAMLAARHLGTESRLKA